MTLYNLLYSVPVYNTMVVFRTICLAIMFIAALVAIVLILFQQRNSDGIQGITGSSETFFGKNKGKSIESKLKKWSWICLTVLAVVAVGFYIFEIVISNMSI